MPIHPEEYASASAYDLLSAAGRGHLVLDHRSVEAIAADPARSLPDLLRFAGEDHTSDRVDVSEDMMALFAVLPTADALPFLMNEIRRFPDDVPDAMLEALLRAGPAAIDALLALEDLGKESEVPFLAAAVGRSYHPAVRAMIDTIRETNPEEAEFLQEVGEGPAEELPPFDFRRHFPERADPDLAHLDEKDRREFLASPHADFRALALGEYVNTELTDTQVDQFLKMGTEDPDAGVRGLAWEALRDSSDRAPVAAAMLARLESAGLDPVERASLACGLAYLCDDKLVRQAIDESYQTLPTRAKAIETMWRTLDTGYAPRIAPHLGDDDPGIRSEAIAAVGFLRMRDQLPRLRAIFLDDDFRHDALHSYMMAAPVPAESRLELKRLRSHVEQLAEGFSELDEAVVDQAIETRLELSGHATPPPNTAKAASTKVGRNDPCPCGSGKKYKKCCGVG